ncbi:hypothetical protein LV82_01942 [Albidovulum inexpectatum]|uniref:DUF484 family protein n=1 Tax=Albidovulum inexpectatum TaxID=196587 RepID=A0A2S5JGJ4_9RHOB|nr:DUF484 family protein [Albidovulum inexpectatum]PPB80593.1 hypothetical protein LV82_01942 [Albidovulum inexpectatum]
MAETAILAEELRRKLLAQPEVILEDPDLMKALIRANERAMGANIVDLRGIAMERLEARLARLEDTHRSVIAAAYENLAGTSQIHRAVLSLLEPADFESFLRNLGEDVARILRVRAVRLVLETHADQGDPALERFGDILCLVGPGFADAYLNAGRVGAPRNVVLRQTAPDEAVIFGEDNGWIRSEAVMRLDFGAGRLPGLLALGSADAHQFDPAHGTDLLGFLAGVFERTMRRWLG